MGGAIFPPAILFSRRVISAGEFFSANDSIWIFFFLVRKMAENPVGFLPHPSFLHKILTISTILPSW